mmetsp:Transcript_35261/g.62879  ORF Transcript_35261/g.62879 Transcript_35261/m.62879 type:complete len:167 (-) Transcript_35261:498-998(-)|eukprot:CAMPEP_0177769022 /NCGR_PEP_ID=MMETSP0491_2-20121128/10074_1 /TAXON_ID=63592 /ORGANISM="Tetraselmis chuii, Strain PLY429" /LENGTH=166 /DNA_ID=CAMNT_0019285951 /DNA_START=78 /DNA_END=578 /DNA_ORIENTATION=-
MIRPQRASAVIHHDELPFRSRSPLTVFSLYCLFCFVLVCALHAIHFILGRDPLAHPLVVGKYVSIDSWSFVHVVCFLGVGFLYPEQPVTYFVYGCVWEAIEFGLTYTTPSLKAFWTERGVNSVWDLWFNLAGYRLGEYLLVQYVVWQRKKARAAERRAKREAAKKK